MEHLLFAGKSTCKRLKSLGIYTIGDLAQADSGMLFAHMKKHGLALQEYAKGMKAPECLIWMRKIKDAETAITTPEDVTDPAYARQILLSLCETVGIGCVQSTKRRAACRSECARQDLRTAAGRCSWNLRRM